MSSRAHVVSEETQVTLLLCGPLLASKQKGEAPLSPREFGKLKLELEKAGASLRELLGAGAGGLLEKLPLEVDRAKVEALLGRGFLLSLALEKWSGMGLWVISRSDESYPKRLKERLQQQAPPLLYGCGDLELLERGGVAIVGSRDVDEAGASFTQALAGQCAAETMTVISGGAKGVDQIAMRSAAERGGAVAGIMANDLARAVTSANARDLIHEKRVTLASPFDPEAGFNVGNAMARNKVIYALAEYGVVVSSGEQEGGTWAGALEQLQKFKHAPVFVREGENVPSGNKALIKAGGIPMNAVPKGGLREFFANNARGKPAPVEMMLNL